MKNGTVSISLEGIELVTGNVTRLHRRSLVHVRADILKTLIDTLNDRFSSDEEMLDIIQPFIQHREDTNIRQVHAMLDTDLPFASLNLEFQEIVHQKLYNELSLTDQIKKFVEPKNSKYENVRTILCRINALTPQSADTER